MMKEIHYKFALIILFFICAVSKAQEFSEKIELPEIIFEGEDFSEENFMIFKSTWKYLGTFKDRYKGTFKGYYLKDNVYLEPIAGKVDVDYNRQKVRIKSINNEDFLSLFREVVPATLGFSLFSYEIITNNPKNIRFRCIDKGDKTWGFRILSSDNYDLDKGIEQIFIVKLDEKGSLKEIQISYEHSKKELNYHLTTLYGVGGRGAVIIKKINAELQNPTTKNIMKLEIDFEN